ncbi:GAF domain-containing protein [Devosia sp. PTR5]|uniref:histidine kinase n=1 Tax=Devosia oryzisoli TaxID=2774138 RepID=A0A927FV55_9HYPH|nr:HWE histidine kinase domain-containing protein [Devosia oryzisoli]MBD8065378.1 GAF domain-containing protein [Devosia oryzisoli]
MNPSQPVDLTNCDREPIHIPGSIQPHGALLATDVTVTTVLRHSANAPDMLGLPADPNGMTLEAVLGGELTHTLRNALATAGDAGRPALMIGQKLANGATADIAIHRYLSDVIIEFEIHAGDHPDQPLQLARTMIGRVSSINEILPLARQTARLVRGLLGYDRVMIYQFEADGSGKVISEAKRPDLESFLGQYFPATDIPRQARALYLKNTIRVISDSRFSPVPLVPQFDASGEPLDLSYAHLRSVSPIHCEYLRNMGVGASMSVSIIVDGELWGMIACHNYSPKVLPMALRVATEMFGDFLSLHLGTLRQKLRLDTAARARAYLDRIQQMATGRDVADLLVEQVQEMGDVLRNDGFGLYLDGVWTGFGSTPPLDAIPDLARFVGSVADNRVWATHAVASRFAPAEDYYGDAAGLLAIPLSQLPRDYIFFFRKEMLQTLNWAGNPEKSYETGPMGDRLTPRKSFAIWKETVHRQAEPWSESEREIAEAMRSSIVEVLLRHSELMADERAKSDVRQRMLNEELNHRVKNILAVIKSLVGQPVQEGKSLQDYVDSLRGRIQALALAHDQVIRGDGGGRLADLLQAELSPYRTSSNVADIVGPDVWLDARAFSVMALVSHELATNAAKYGALSVAGGRLSINWDLAENGDCHLKWQEFDGPPVRPPTRQGFGTALLDRSLPYELNGTSDITYAPDGLRAEFCLPARNLRGGGTVVKVHVVDAQAPKAQRDALPADLHILLLEDQMLIAMDVETMLADRGFEAISTTNAADQALRLLDTRRPDIAMLDVNLGVGTSVPVAEKLTALGVPFVFATGYGEGGAIPEHLSQVPVVRKPYQIGSLMAALARAYREASGS